MNGEVLVVGGGIAGLGLARALSARGVRCALVDRAAPGPSTAGFGVNLPGNAVRALAALGLAEEVVDRGVRIRRREYRSGTGRLLFAVDEEAFWGGPSVCLRHGDLHEILRAGAADVPARRGTAVVGVEARPDGPRVHFGAEPAQDYDVVVGADGVQSAVRPTVSPDADLRPSPMAATSWRFIAPNPGVSCWTVWSGGAGTILLIPVAEHLVYGYASATRGGASGDGPSWLSATFADFPEPVTATVAAVLDGGTGLYRSPVEEVRCDRWSRGRVILIGDAAHATAPVWAQGAALALEDALVLADLLANRPDRAGVGADFERTRRRRVEHVQASTDRMSRIARLPGWIRDLSAPFAGPRAYRHAYGQLRTPAAATGPRGGDQ